jgi:hypothetical protein
VNDGNLACDPWLLVLLDIAAMRWGVDSRDGFAKTDPDE